MAREPAFPQDASIGRKSDKAPTAPQSSLPEAPPAAAGSSTTVEGEGPTGSSEARRKKHLMAGAAIGIGSAAIVAALLYANRSRRDRRETQS